MKISSLIHFYFNVADHHNTLGSHFALITKYHRVFDGRLTTERQQAFKIWDYSYMVKLWKRWVLDDFLLDFIQGN